MEHSCGVRGRSVNSLIAWRTSVLIKTVISFFLIVIVVASWFNSDAFNLDLKKAYHEAFNAFVNVELSCILPSEDFNRLSQAGLKARALQDNKNMLDATLAIDGIGTSIILKNLLMLKDISDIGTVDICARAYFLADAQCPEAFIRMTKQSKDLLATRASIE